MGVSAPIDISDVIDGQKRSGFLIRFVALLCLMALFDGYDYSAMGFAAPSLIREWHLDKAAFGAVFVIGNVGSIIGAFGFGYIADRWGRRRAAISATASFGLFSLLTLLATNLSEVIVLRFLAGIGIGALVPIIFTIAVEFAPQRMRSGITLIAVISIGIGIMIAGFISAALIPMLGWHVIFWIAGIVPLGISVLAYFALPESPRFLISRNRPPTAIGTILRRINPSFQIPPDAVFTDRKKIAPPIDGSSRIPAAMLFRGRLAIITPLLWVAYFFCTMSTVFLVTWTPTLGEGLGIESRYAAIAVSTGGFGLIAASLLLIPVLDRFGAIVIWPLPLIAVPAYLVLSIDTVSNIEFVALFVVIGFAMGGGQSGLNSTVGLFYPDECRGTGVSWALAISRLGGAAGPAIAGLPLALGFPIKSVFLVMAVPALLFSVCSFGLGLLHRRIRRDAKPAADRAAVGELSSATP